MKSVSHSTKNKSGDLKKVKYRYARAFRKSGAKDEKAHRPVVVDPHDYSEQRVLIQRLKRDIMGMKFRYPTDMLVLYDLLFIAFYQNSLVIRASCRELALMSAIGHMTASKSLKRLRSMGAIRSIENKAERCNQLPRHLQVELMKKGNAYEITLHELMIDNTEKSVVLDAPDMSEPGLEFREMTKDVWRDGITFEFDQDGEIIAEILRPGKRGGRIWTVLNKFPMLTAKEIQHQTGYSLRTVQYKLKRMMSSGLVEKFDAKNYRIKPAASIDDLERHLGLHGKHEMDFNKFIAESEDWERMMDLWHDDFDTYKKELERRKAEKREQLRSWKNLAAKRKRFREQ